MLDNLELADIEINYNIKDSYSKSSVLLSYFKNKW